MGEVILPVFSFMTTIINNCLIRNLFIGQKVLDIVKLIVGFTFAKCNTIGQVIFAEVIVDFAQIQIYRSGYPCYRAKNEIPENIWVLKTKCCTPGRAIGYPIKSPVFR